MNVAQLALASKDPASTIREGRVLFDAALARHVLENMNYERQRRIEQNHVDALASLMRAGLFLQGGQIAFGRLGGKLTLVNGQHRLSGVVASDLAQEFQVLIVDCATEAEFKALYWRFDNVSRNRSVEQILNAAGVAADNALSEGMAKAVFGAVGFIMNGMRSPLGSHAINAVERRVTDFRLEACQPFWPIARVYDDVTSKANGVFRRRLQNGSVTAVALMTLKHQEDRARLFWGSAADNDGLRRGDPRHTLVQHLTSITSATNRADALMGCCAAAWNAFYSGRNLSMLRPSMPIRLLGTPVGREAGH